MSFGWLKCVLMYHCKEPVYILEVRAGKNLIVLFVDVPIARSIDSVSFVETEGTILRNW